MKKSSIFILLMTVLLISLESLLSVNFTYAYASGNIGLLTVSESNNNTEVGGIANLYLLVKPGSGRIFIDSFPLSKIDTQITMRFAAEVACDLLDKDCSNYDFFYTITANSAIVGGPSAGAAATVLTVSVLDNVPLDNTTIMTGTINSGNLIGPVAGVPAKALAAQKSDYKRVLIPRWDVVNNTPDANLTINVIPISTLETALFYFTGKNYSTQNSDLYTGGFSNDYTDMMRQVAVDLCSKYGTKNNGALVLPNLTLYGVNITNATQDNFVLALNAINNKSYYSAASFCFGGNVRITNVLMQNFTVNEQKIAYAKLLSNITDFKRKLDAESTSISTISQLETYMIVAQRLSEAKSILSDMSPENISISELAYATERFNTAVIWSRFSNFPGQKFVMDKDLMKIACTKKISEAEERLNYLELYYPNSDIRSELDKAYNYYNSADYALCIFTSSQVKAESDIVLSAIFVPEIDMDRLFDEKLNAARRVISKQEKANTFPILGYSYYEYALTLKNTDKYSSLLYAEYSLELSNIDMYFTKKAPLTLSNTINVDKSYIYMLVLGFVIGILVTLLIVLLLSRSKNVKKEKSGSRRKKLGRK